MKLTKLAAIALAALTLTAGVAVAAPGNAPDGIADERADANANDEADAADERDANASAADERDAARGESADAGPPADLPEQVPDHVSAIHELIQQHIDGVLEGDLGAAVSDVASGNGDERADDGDAAENGTVTPTPDDGDAAENGTATATAEG